MQEKKNFEDLRNLRKLWLAFVQLKHPTEYDRK